MIALVSCSDASIYLFGRPMTSALVYDASRDGKYGNRSSTMVTVVHGGGKSTC